MSEHKTCRVCRAVYLSDRPRRICPDCRQDYSRNYYEKNRKKFEGYVGTQRDKRAQRKRTQTDSVLEFLRRLVRSQIGRHAPIDSIGCSLVELRNHLNTTLSPGVDPDSYVSRPDLWKVFTPGPTYESWSAGGHPCIRCGRGEVRTKLTKCEGCLKPKPPKVPPEPKVKVVLRVKIGVKMTTPNPGPNKCAYHHPYRLCTRCKQVYPRFTGNLCTNCRIASRSFNPALKFYVYAHWGEEGECFYIGKGSGHRLNTFKTRSSLWKTLTDHGQRVKRIEKLETGLSEADAFAREQHYISRLNPAANNQRTVAFVPSRGKAPKTLTNMDSLLDPRLKKRPLYGTELGNLIHCLTVPASLQYDHEFTLKIKSLKPSWFIEDRVRHSKNLLLSLEERPKTKSPEYRRFYRYLIEDREFREAIRRKHPSWIGKCRLPE